MKENINNLGEYLYKNLCTKKMTTDGEEKQVFALHKAGSSALVIFVACSMLCIAGQKFLGSLEEMEIKIDSNNIEPKICNKSFLEAIILPSTDYPVRGGMC